MKRLIGKVAVITGGAGGIGQAAAKLFTAEGAHIVLVDLYEAALQSAVQAIGNDMVSYVVADTTQPEQVQHYVTKAIERFGGIDIFLANAGIEGARHPPAPLHPQLARDPDRALARVDSKEGVVGGRRRRVRRHRSLNG